MAPRDVKAAADLARRLREKDPAMASRTARALRRAAERATYDDVDRGDLLWWVRLANAIERELGEPRG
jgi:hypothetical protein